MILRRLWNLLSPRPRMCPECGDVLKTRDVHTGKASVVCTEWTCYGAQCGYRQVKYY